MNRRAFLARAAGVLGAGCVGTAGYTWGVEPHWAEVVCRSLPIERLPEQLAGARLAQISDLHVGTKVDDDYLIACLQRIRSLEPDILVLTGDLLSFQGGRGEAQFEQLRRVLHQLSRGRLATLAVLGNHDYGRNWSDSRVARRISQDLALVGVRVLRNECAPVSGLDVVGVDDLWARRADPAGALARRTGPASLVLCHNPDTLDERPWGGYRGWILAGHTHGGQCRPPFLAPPILPVRNPLYAAGEVRLPDGRSLYVNRGLGHLERVRFNVRPEITVFTLRQA